MKVSIGVDVSDLIAGLNKAEDKLSAFRKAAQDAVLTSAFTTSIKTINQLETEISALNNAIKNTSSVTELKALNDQLKKLESQANNLKVVGFESSLHKVESSAKQATTALGKVPGGANSATFALTNLGRVVQDAPFGFIGIANNINPLLESFQRLQKESGGTKSALKILVSSLAGAGGLGLAVSIGTAALSLFGMAMQKSGSEAKKAAEKTDEYGKVVQGIAQKTAEQVASVDVLVKAYQRENISQQERVSIIQELKRISPEYFNQLNQEKTSIDQLTLAYRAYAKSIDDSIIQDIKRDKLKTLLTRRIQLQVQFNQNEKNDPFAALFNEIPKSAQKAVDKANNIFRKSNPFDKKVLDPKDIRFDEFEQGVNEINKLNKEIGEIELALAKGLVIKPADVNKTKKAGETIAEVLAKLKREIDLLNETELTLGTNEYKAKISAIESTISRLVKDFNVSPRDTIITKLFGDILELTPGIERFKQMISDIKVTTTAQILIDQAQVQKEADDKLGKVKMKMKVEIQNSIDNSDYTPPGFFPTSSQYSSAKYAHEKFLNEIKQSNQTAADNVRGTLDEAFASIGVSIAESLGSGASFGETVFGNLFKVLGAGIKQLGEAMIGIGTAKIALEKFKFAPGIATVVAGIATVALGSLLQKALPGFANGVSNFGGGYAMVGERGPEIVKLPKGADVIPNGRLNGMSATSGMAISVEGRIVGNGSDLVMIIDRARQRNSRNN
jgi:hypothetical protein